MAEVSAFLLAVLIIIIVIAVILIVIVYANRRNSTTVTNTSTPTVNVCTAAPPIPSGLVLTNPQSDLLVATWNLLVGSPSYTVYLGTTSGFSTVSALSTKTVTSNSTSFGNLTLGITYYVKLIATNTCGSSALSPESSITIPYSFPTRFTVAYAQNTAVQMCWSDNIYHPTYQESGSIFCDFNTSWLNFHAGDNTIRAASDATRCLTRTGGNQVWMNTCIPDSTQTWTYNGLDSTLCDPANPTTHCLNIGGLNSAGGTITFGAKGTSATSAWDIIPT